MTETTDQDIDFTDEKVEKIAQKACDAIALIVASEKFKKEFRERSFSGRNPELGPMIKCVQCGLRHRDNVKHEPIKYTNKPGTPEGESNPMIAETKKFKPVANASGWRAKPGKLMWIKELKKFMTLTR